jgi:hypothetical protein
MKAIEVLQQMHMAEELSDEEEFMAIVGTRPEQPDAAWQPPAGLEKGVLQPMSFDVENTPITLDHADTDELSDEEEFDELVASKGLSQFIGQPNDEETRAAVIEHLQKVLMKDILHDT